MAEFNFQKLNVYQKAKAMSVELIRLAVKFPHVYRRLSDQLIGASSSICLNIAEGSGRKNAKEKIQFFKIAQGSAYETVALLEIVEDLRLISEKEYYINEIESICRMLGGLVKKQNN